MNGTGNRSANILKYLGYFLIAAGIVMGVLTYVQTPASMFEKSVTPYVVVLAWILIPIAVGGVIVRMGGKRLGAEAARPKGGLGSRLGHFLSMLGPFVGLILVYLIFLIHTRKMGIESFAYPYNTKTILTQAVIIGIGALGMTVVIISAGIDLSAGSLVALGTVVTALVLRDFGIENSMGFFTPLLAAAAGVAACAFCGFINGFIIAVFGIVPFIVTLGMMQIARGMAKGLAESTMVNTPENWLWGLMKIEPKAGVWWSVAPAVWVMIILLIAMFIVLRYTVFGRYVFAVGSNEATARLCGINVKLQKIWVYTLSGTMVGIASIMQYASLTQGDPTAGIAMELDIIAAVVIGGGSLSGGQGSVIGSIAGALIIAVLRNGCNLVGIENYVQNIVIGTIIITAVGVDRLKHRGEAA